MTINDLNIWLKNHQLLVTLVATPALSFLVGGFAAWYTGKRAIFVARTERMHQSALEIARYRQAWIDALRDDLAEFAGVAAIAYKTEPPDDKIERISVLSMRIRMRMNRDDADYQLLVDTLTRENTQFFLGDNNQQNEGVPLVVISQAILKREWERLKGDLQKAES